MKALTLMRIAYKTEKISSVRIRMIFIKKIDLKLTLRTTINFYFTLGLRLVKIKS